METSGKLEITATCNVIKYDTDLSEEDIENANEC